MSSAVFTIVLATHLIAANFATAGPFVALWLEMRGRRRGDERATSLARQAIATSMGSLAVAMVLGLVAVGLMWWRWPAALDAGFGSVPQSRLWFGGVELAFYFVCLAAYLPLARGPSAARSRSRQATLVALALLAGTDVAYHFPPLFAVVGTYGANPDSLPSGASFLALMLEPEPLALTIHFLLASIAVGGVGLSWLAIRPGTASPEIALTSGRLALAATLGQLLSGGWLVVATNDAMRGRLLGDDSIATCLFAAGVITATLLMHKLAAVSLAVPERRDVTMAASWLVLTIFLMTAAQQASRIPAYQRVATLHAP